MPISNTRAPPPQYRAIEAPHETTPLNGSPQDCPHKSKHTRWQSWLLVAIFFLFVLGPVIGVHLFSDWKNNDGPAIRERERRRAQWAEEDRERERERVAEDLEREHKRAEEDRERERRRAEEDKEHERRLSKWAEEDRARLEDEDHRMRTALYWEGPTPADECLRYGTRMYSARLMNIPPGVDGKRWCQETEITIHEDYIAKPDFCNEELGEIFGHWLKMNEPTCKNIWEDFNDKGCLAKGSGKRRIEAKLGFLEYIKGPWREMCSTTPADFWGHHSAGPDTCADTGGRVLGVWLVNDREC